MLILSPYFVYRPRVEIKLQILRFQLPPPPPPHFLPFPLDKKTEKKRNIQILNIIASGSFLLL